jgi:nucleotide-binding universal stress UspA family protein
MNRHILVAVGPSFSEDALSTAIAKAKETGARLTVLHVIDISPWWSGTYAEGLCDTQAMVHQLALVIRRRSEMMLRHAGIEFDWQMRSSPRDGRTTGRVIAQTASALGADLIVLGTRKRGWLGIGLHPVRNGVCRYTTCEVLIATESARPSARVIAMPAAMA